MVLNKVCPPALIYLVFSMTQVTIDTIYEPIIKHL